MNHKGNLYTPLQSPVEVRKNPVAHLAHAVPLLAVVKPSVQVQAPLDPHSPLIQLHVDGELDTCVTKHLPVPEIPSSHFVQLDGHAWQLEPKKPDAQDSHDSPRKPRWTGTVTRSRAHARTRTTWRTRR